jgi:hypothetical protein
MKENVELRALPKPTHGLTDIHSVCYFILMIILFHTIAARSCVCAFSFRSIATQSAAMLHVDDRIIALN